MRRAIPNLCHLRFPGESADYRAARNALLAEEVQHIARRLRLALVAKSPLPRVLALARDRGWRRPVYGREHQ
jgi:predicted dithiol-disulfide oxidoreductase (DUF899 family)